MLLGIGGSSTVPQMYEAYTAALFARCALGAAAASVWGRAG